MDHSGMDHSGMDHSGMDHSSMDHSGMDHSGMDHSGMDHSGMDHSGHDMVAAVVNSTARAIVDAINTGMKMASGDDVDHSSHMGHSGHMGHGDQLGHTGHIGDAESTHDHGEGAGHGGMMSMAFHFGCSETILFSWWKTSNVGGLIGSMVGIFILAMLYEGLKYWREHLFRKAIAAMQYCANVQKANGADENKTVQYMEQIIMPPTMNMLSKDHGIQTVLHMLQMVVSYFLMLIFMTYNVWLCLAVVLGAGVGYFLFGWRKSVVVDITEHCH